MAGALDSIYDLIDSTGKASKQAYSEGRAANDEAQRVLSQPRTDRSGLAFAAGILGGSRSGHFGEELSNGLKGYMGAADKYEEEELGRQEKIARLKAANASLLGSHAGTMYDLGMKRFGAPGLALKAAEDQEDLDDLLSGNSGIPAMPSLTPPTEPPTEPPTTPPTTPPPAPAPTSAVPPTGPAPNPNETVGSLPGGGFGGMGGQDVMMGGIGSDPMATGGAPSPYPPEMPQQAPQQVAQAQTGARPQPQMPQPSQPAGPPPMEKQLYDWAMQVRAAAAQDPGKWARRKKNAAALSQAEKIIDDYDRKFAPARGVDPVKAELDKLLALEQLKKATKENSSNPFDRAMVDDEAKVIIESRKNAEAANKSLNDFEIVRELRKRPIATGPLGQWVTRGADLFGVGGGQALEGRGADIWVQAVEPLKGALSNQEGARFDAGNPGNLSMNDPEAEILIKLGQLAAQRAQQKNAFLETYRERNGSLQGAPQAWGRFIQEKKILSVDGNGEPVWNEGNVNAWEDYVGLGAAPQRAAPDTAPGRTLTPQQLPQVRTAEDYANVQPGSNYIDPKGNIKLKPRQ